MTTIYVDGTNGNDAWAGTQNKPVQSLIRAQELIEGLDDYLIRVVNGRPGDAAFACPTFEQPRGVGWIIFDELEEVVGQTAAGAGSNDAKIITSGLTDGALEGYAVEVLTGAAAGKRATIRRNTTTEIFLAAAASEDIAENDLYRVIRPGAGARLESLVIGEPLVRGWSAPPQPAAAGRDYAPGLRIVNARIDLQLTTPWPTPATLSEGASLALFGCEIDEPGASFINMRASQLLCGRAAWDTVDGPDASSLSAWAGWGVFWPGAFPVFDGVCGFISGYLVADRYVAFAGQHQITGRLTGGPLHVHDNNSADQNSQVRLQFGKVAPFLPLIEKGTINNLASGFAAVYVEDGAHVELGDNTELDSNTTVIYVRNATVHETKDIAIKSGVDGIRIISGGEYVHASSGTISGATNLTGDQIAVGNTPTTGDFADYDAAGDFLVDGSADDGSIFRSI